MAPPRALRDLTLALGAAVVALGSLLFIAWKLYFRDTELGASWDSWWEREVRELRDRAPAGSTVRREPLAGTRSVMVTRRDPRKDGEGAGSSRSTEPLRLGKVHGVWVLLGCSPGHLHPQSWGVRSTLGAHPAGEGGVGCGGNRCDPPGISS